MSEWRCFHCDEVFTTRECAAEHFGKFEDCQPICKVGADLFRKMEDELASYRNESDAASKEFYSLGAAHAVALRREEERGYERGMRDARAESLRATLQGVGYQQVFNAIAKATRISPPAPDKGYGIGVSVARFIDALAPEDDDTRRPDADLMVGNESSEPEPEDGNGPNPNLSQGAL